MKYNLIKFILIGGFAGTVSLGGIYFGLQRFNQRNIVPATIDQRAIDQRTIEQRQLSAVRDLKGTWEGKATFNLGQKGRCSLPGTITLTINNQTENAIFGTFIFDYGSGEYTYPSPGAKAPLTGCRPGATTFPITGNLVGTKIENISCGILGIFSGSYTRDTITLNQTEAVDNGYGVKEIMNGPANLLRQ